MLACLNELVALEHRQAGVHRGHELEAGREGQRAVRAGDGDDFVLQRLAHHFERLGGELGQLVQEQTTEVVRGPLC